MVCGYVDGVYVCMCVAKSHYSGRVLSARLIIKISRYTHTNKTNSFVCMHVILSLKMIIIIIAEKKETLVNSEIANRERKMLMWC